MYERFFGLDELPFQLTPDPRYLFLSSKHREALGHLVYGIREGAGFVCITGEIGAGKTTLLRALLREADDTTKYAYILNPVLTGVELLEEINHELGAPSSGTRRELLAGLNRVLVEQRAQGRRVVLVVDEAQSLDGGILEQLRLLSNFETESAKLLQVVLVGQPELRQLLARPDLEQLNQRITVRWHLGCMDRAETAQYVAHRVRTAGQTRSLFDKGAIAVVHEHARGTPRLINVAAHRALMVAYAESSPQVTRAIARRAIADLERHLPPRAQPRAGARRAAWATASLAAAAAVAIGGTWWWKWSPAQRAAMVDETAAPAPPGGESGAPAPVISAAGGSDALRGVGESAVPRSAVAPATAEEMAQVASGSRPAVAQRSVEPSVAVAAAEAEAAAGDAAPGALPQDEAVALAAAEAPADGVAAVVDGGAPVVRPGAIEPPAADSLRPGAPGGDETPEARLAAAEGGEATAAPSAAEGSPEPATERPESLADQRLLVSEALRQTTTGNSAYESTEALLRAWGAKPLSAREAARPTIDLAAIGRARGLEYLPVTGNLNLLRSLDLPAILEVITDDGSSQRFVAVTRLDDEVAHVLAGRAVVDVSPIVLAESWSGRAHVYWKDLKGMGTMRSGSSGRRVRRLHGLLRAAGVYEGPDATVFSAETTDAVSRFQRSRKLPADGKAGPMTMIALYQSLADEGVPRLAVLAPQAVLEAAPPAPPAESRADGSPN